MSNDNGGYIFRQCITLRNGKRICRPKGQAFRIPISSAGHPEDKPENQE
ncbi:hypothetical protein [Novosphingobium arvoryzae]